MSDMPYEPHHPPYDEVNKRAYSQIPVEVFHRTNWRQTGLLLFSVLFMVGLLNTVAYAYLQTQDAAIRTLELLPLKWHLLQDLDAPVDLLILGDSSANQGVVSERLSQALDEQSLNLATNGFHGLVNEVWMLEDYIERFGPPRGVVIIHVYDTFRRDVPLSMLRDLPKPLGFWNDFTPPLQVSISDELSYLSDRLFPIYTREETLKGLLQRFIANASNSPLQLQTAGFMRADVADPARVVRELESHISYTQTYSFEISPINQQAFDQLLILMERYDFPVYYKMGPVHDELYDAEPFNAYWKEIEGWLLTTAEAHENFCFLPRPMVFPADQLQNADHVIYSAAVEYTDQVIVEIQACQAMRDD